MSQKVTAYLPSILQLALIELKDRGEIGIISLHSINIKHWRQGAIFYSDLSLPHEISILFIKLRI